MERRKRQYSLYQRPTNKRNIKKYYARFRDPKTGEFKSGINTGFSRKEDAIEWCVKYLQDEKEHREHITLDEYSRGFWNYSGKYAQSKIARGYSISRGFLSISEGYTRNHILPVWGSDRIQDLTPGKIDAQIIRLRKETALAPATINKILQTLRTMLDQAVADGWLSENPAAFVKPLKNEYTERGTFTPTEMKKLFNPSIWLEYKHYALNLFAACTGARLGEIRGLSPDCVHRDHVNILFSWEQSHGLTAPKCGSIRDVPINFKIFNALDRVIVETKPEKILFFSDAGKDRPLSKTVIEKHLYKAMARIGIDEIERRERKLVFHSHQHTLNTPLRSHNISDAKIRRITGHKNEETQDRYTHFRASDYKEVVEVQSALIGGAE
jgi:integrase